MIIFDPRKWDIIGKLRMLIIAFFAVIIIGALIIGIRWITTGSTVQVAYFTFEKALEGTPAEIAQMVSKSIVDQKLDNVSVNILPKDPDHPDQNRLTITAVKIDEPQVVAIGKSLQEAFKINLKGKAIVESETISGQPLNWGLDFTGGTILEMTFKNPFINAKGDALPDIDVLSKVRSAFAINGVPITVAQVQRVATEAEEGKNVANSILVRTQESSNTKLKPVIDELKKTFGDDYPEKQRVDTIGPVIGNELKANSIKALLIALAVIFLYIAIRFQPRAGVAAIACLVHDLFFILGALSLIWIEVNSAAVAALLSFISYDVQDTIVIMDRVRENTRLYIGRMKYADLINLSVTSTFMRSLNTSIATLWGILVMLIFGGSTILDFTLIFFLGLFAGAWSSLYIAAPLLVVWKNIEESVMKRRGNAPKVYELSTPEGVRVQVRNHSSESTVKNTQQTRTGEMLERRGPPKKKTTKGKRRR